MAKRKKGPAPGTAPKKKKRKGAPPGLLGSDAEKPAKRKRAAKKVKAPSGKKPKKAKAPCKYGARVNGRCPKKPKVPAVTLARESIRFVTGTKAEKARAKETLGAVGKAVTEQAAVKVVREAHKELRGAVRTEKGKAALKKLGAAAATLGRRALGVGGIVGLNAAILTGMNALADRETLKQAAAEVEKVQRTLGGKLTQPQYNTLLRQHFDFIKRRAIAASKARGIAFK